MKIRLQTSTFRHIFIMSISVWVIFLSMNLSAGNAQKQSLDEIKSAVKTYLITQLVGQTDSQYDINITHLDQRLQLTACPNELNITLPDGFDIKPRMAVKVICDSTDTPWSLYVPVLLKKYEKVAVAAMPIEKSTVITAKHLTMQVKNTFDLRQYSIDMDTYLGLEAKRFIPSGKVMSQLDLEKPIAIKRGQQVSLKASNPRVHVSMRGIAMKNGSVGDRITVKNLSSKKLVDGVVIGPETVEVLR